MDLDNIVYGNPTIPETRLLNTDSFVDRLFTELTEFTFPKNSSEATKEELNYIVSSVDELRKDEELQRKYSLYDKYLYRYYINFIVQRGGDEQHALSICEDVVNDTAPLIAKLKYYFQRPRPAVLAYYMKLKLMPFASASSNNPSFPSGHAMQSRLLSEIFGNQYPEIYNDMMLIHEDICRSRIAMGLHYQSDIDVGIFAAEKALGMKEFKIKHQL